MREFTVVMRDGQRFVLEATSPTDAEQYVLKVVLRNYYNVSDIRITYEVTR